MPSLDEIGPMTRRKKNIYEIFCYFLIIFPRNIRRGPTFEQIKILIIQELFVPRRYMAEILPIRRKILSN